MQSKLCRHNLFVMGLAAVLSIAASDVYAKGRGAVEFPAVVEKEGYSFRLQGKGYKRVLFMKAFEAGFYTTQGVAKEDLLNDVPKYLEVEYHVAIPAKSLTDYTINQMKNNITREEFSGLNKEIALMEKYFVDLKPHDRFSLAYIPGVGTQFSHNGKLTGVISGEKFGKALFSVWIGAKPFDLNLKRKILGLITEDDDSDEELRLAGLEETTEPAQTLSAGEI